MAEEKEIYQVFVKLLDGKSKALNFPSPSISPLTIKRRLSLLTGISISDQLLVSGGRHLTEGPHHTFPLFCNLLSRLRGGKGGFGSLLRGAATKAGQKKTNNFDACRDMSGRRLRHVNAEKRLVEWAAEAEERALEKSAEEFLRKKMKAEGKRKKEDGGVETEKYVGKYREDSARCMEVVEKSVREAIGKKRKAKRESVGDSSKKLKIWMGKRKVDNSDSDDSDEDDSDNKEEQEKEKSVVLDNENHLDSSKEPGGSSDSVTGGNFSAGGSSENSSDGDGEIAVKETSVKGESSGEAMVEDTVPQNRAASFVEKTLVSETETVENNNVTVGQQPTNDAEMIPNLVVTPALPEIIVKSTAVADVVKPFNFEEFNSSAELEVLGMEMLKSELQSRGLKCGGTLQERAARLFLLKTTPLEKLPKKLLAKK